MRAAILNQINSWWSKANWQNPDKADRIHQKLNEAPERFISPNPGTPYREEASRIYGEIKEDYSLRTQNQAVDEYRDLAQKADRHYQKRQNPEPEPETPEDTGQVAYNPEVEKQAEKSDPVRYPDESREITAGDTFETSEKYDGRIGLLRLFTEYNIAKAKAKTQSFWLHTKLAYHHLKRDVSGYSIIDQLPKETQ
jgi:hypothetical protein